MEVKIKKNELGLSLDKNYFVYELINDINNQLLIRIENDYKQIFTYEIKKFNIINEKEPERWITVSRDDEVIKTFVEFSGLGFWENFYNDDIDSLKKFHSIKVTMFAMDFDSEKVNSILHFSNCDEQILLIDSLKFNLRSEFVNSIIQYSRIKFNDDAVKFRFELESAFEYLSCFKNESIDECFIEFYGVADFQTKSLTGIVDNYFNPNQE